MVVLHARVGLAKLIGAVRLYQDCRKRFLKTEVFPELVCMDGARDATTLPAGVHQ